LNDLNYAKKINLLDEKILKLLILLILIKIHHKLITNKIKQNKLKIKLNKLSNKIKLKKITT